jgi:pimeloyl-ACP methyl ester carboxylesterase
VPTRPETRYAKAADGVHIAYQVVGDGPVDVVAIIGWVTNLEAMWEEPRLARFLRRLAESCRLILFDKRGVGLSDRVPDSALPTLEARMDDARAVLDAVGSTRAIVFGVSEGGPMAMQFAATYPDRTIALLLFGTSADWTVDQDPDGEYEAGLETVEREWGTIEYAREQLRSWAAPSLAADDRAAEWLASYMRRAASPGAAIALSRMNRGLNVSAVLQAIHVPTLVLARTGDLDFPLEEVRRTAAAIPGARLVEVPGDDHFFFAGDSEPLLAEILRFVKTTGDDEAELDRVLATVLFTDIVASSERLSALGDRGWRSLVEAHNDRLRGLFGRFRGHEVDTTGDGFLVTFDGPIRAVRCALAATAAVRDLGLEIRAGLHTGEVELAGSTVRGIAVHVGARVSALAGPSEVLTSAVVKDLVTGSALRFEDRGVHVLKGIPGDWHLFRALA